IGDRDLVFQVRSLAAAARILVGADVVPGPAVERAFTHARDVVGWNVIAEPVALIGRAPEFAAPWRDRHADAVADAGREDVAVLALRIEREHCGAVGLIAPGGAEPMRGLPGLQFRRAQLSHSVADI